MRDILPNTGGAACDGAVHYNSVVLLVVRIGEVGLNRPEAVEPEALVVLTGMRRPEMGANRDVFTSPFSPGAAAHHGGQTPMA